MGQRVITNYHIAYNRTIHLYFLDVKFQLLGIVVFVFSQKKPLIFLVQDLFGSILWIFGAMNPVNNVWFWPQFVVTVVQMPFKGFRRTQIFTVTRLTQSLSFWSNFDPNLTPYNGQNQKKPLGYLNPSKSRTWILSIFNKNCNQLCAIWVFSWYKWAHGQRSKGNSLNSTAFLKCIYWGLVVIIRS